MAKAPKPKKGGHDAAKERLARASQALKVTVPGTDLEPFAVPLANLPGLVRRRVRAETGRSIEGLSAEEPGIDIYVLFWWVSRLLAGEDIAFVVAEDDWGDRCAGIRLGDLETEWVTLHDGSDEGADPVGETQGQPD